jgi:hypothetical protein
MSIKIERKIEEKFDTILLEAIDEALLTLGGTAQTSIYFHLATKFAISKQNIPDRVDDFSEALEQIFGLAARQLEILIMKYLNDKIDCSYHWVGPKWLVPNLTFAKYVKMLQVWFEDTKKTGEVEVVMLDSGEQQEQQTN